MTESKIMRGGSVRKVAPLVAKDKDCGIYDTLFRKVVRIAIGFVAFPGEALLFEQPHCEVVSGERFCIVHDNGHSLLLYHRYPLGILRVVEVAVGEVEQFHPLSVVFHRDIGLYDNVFRLIQLAEDAEQIVGDATVADGTLFF